MTIEQKIGIADLHIHTTASDGLTTPSECLALAHQARLNVIAITDHDTVEGAIEAQKKSQEGSLPIDVIIGTEVTTAQGHLVGLFISHKIPMFRSLAETVKIIHGQGGLAIAPHIGLGLPIMSITPEAMRQLFREDSGKEQWLDGIEIAHPIYNRQLAAQARSLWIQYELAPIGVSDDHLGNLGRHDVTCFDAPMKRVAIDSLRTAIETNTTFTRRSNLEPNRIPLNIQIQQCLISLIKGLPEKRENLPVLVSTLISLQRERVEG